MGLVEKRVLNSFKDGKYKELEKKIFKTIGKDVAIEIDWTSLAVDKMSHIYEEAFTKVYFLPL